MFSNLLNPSSFGFGLPDLKPPKIEDDPKLVKFKEKMERMKERQERRKKRQERREKRELEKKAVQVRPKLTPLERRSGLIEEEEVDVTDEKDRGVIKRRMKPGPSYQRPKYDSTVEALVTGYLEGGREFFPKQKLVFKMGAEEVCQAIDLGCSGMVKDEIAIVRSTPQYAYGEKGEKFDHITVPPNAYVSFEIELLDFTEDQYQTWDLDTKIEHGRQKKLEGNVLMKAGKYLRAEKKYELALEYLPIGGEYSRGEKKAKLDAAMLPLHLNIAQCKVKREHYRDALFYIDEALSLEKGNPKALFRKGLVQEALGDWEDAKKSWSLCLRNTTRKIQRKEVRQKLYEINRKLKVDHKRRVVQFGRMFGREPSLKDTLMDWIIERAWMLVTPFRQNFSTNLLHSEIILIILASCWMCWISLYDEDNFTMRIICTCILSLLFTVAFTHWMILELIKRVEERSQEKDPPQENSKFHTD